MKDDTARKNAAYAARLGLEGGTGVVKIKYTGNPESFKWAVKSADKAKAFILGGPKGRSETGFLRQVRGALDADANGLAVSRNVWCSLNP